MFNNNNTRFTTGTTSYHRGGGSQSFRGGAFTGAAGNVSAGHPGVMNEAGNDEADTVQRSNMSSAFGVTSSSSTYDNNARGNFRGNTRGSNFSRGGFQHGGFDRGSLAAPSFSRGSAAAPSFSRGSAAAPSFSRGSSVALSFSRGSSAAPSFSRGGGGGGSLMRGTSSFSGDFQPRGNNNTCFRGAFQQCNDVPSQGITSRGGFATRGSLNQLGESNRNYSRGGGSGGNAVPLGNQHRVVVVDSNPVADKANDVAATPQSIIRLTPAVPDALIGLREEDKEIFGEELAKKLATQKLPRSRAGANFEPALRDINEIFDEDIQHEENYASVVNEDCEVEMEGAQINNFKPMQSWNDATLSKQLRENIDRAKYISPRMVQRYVIPIGLRDRFDLVIHTETGSGKTAAFLIPIIEKCLRAKDNGKFASTPFVPFAVILEPARELAQQCYEQALKLVQGTGVTVAKAYGEYAVGKNRDELFNGCDIICATPGRFADFVARRIIALDKLHFLVFDEGDRLLLDDYKNTIDRAFSSTATIPSDHQTFFISATFRPYDLMRANQYMRQGRVVIFKNKFTVPSPKCDQVFKVVTKSAKFGQIYDYLKDELGKVQKSGKQIPPTLIFFRGRRYCEMLNKGLQMQGLPSVSFCGLSGQDLREKHLSDFRGNNVSIFCVTDLASRGLDVKDVDMVINYDMPEDFETYIHRVGRAGRIRRGKCLSFVDIDVDGTVLRRIKKTMVEAGHAIPQSLDEAIAQTPPPLSVGFGKMKRFAAGGSDNVTHSIDVAADAKKEEEKPKTDDVSTEKEKTASVEDKMDGVVAAAPPASIEASSFIPGKTDGVGKDAASSVPDNTTKKSDDGIKVAVALTSKTPSTEIPPPAAKKVGDTVTGGKDVTRASTKNEGDTVTGKKNNNEDAASVAKTVKENILDVAALRKTFEVAGLSPEAIEVAIAAVIATTIKTEEAKVEKKLPEDNAGDKKCAAAADNSKDSDGDKKAKNIGVAAATEKLTVAAASADNSKAGDKKAKSNGVAGKLPVAKDVKKKSTKNDGFGVKKDRARDDYVDDEDDGWF